MPEIITSAEPETFKAEKLEDIKERTDLNPGHWLYGKKAAKSVLSGESDKVVCESAAKVITLEAISCEAELWEKDPSSKPVEEKPVEDLPGEEKPLGEAVEELSRSRSSV